ncbi:NAD(P)/FAD-dependent oxidoreductase [Corynebacterium sanguinis]|uniref:NAD(P)/FAD-dependent oxidoreductase n=1 Tax=Corynebacterium sanguinis TaxID=2594913 RepID=UPI00223C3AB4|nr:NAD(P)/FAD-dependent oxidoreductase [Corynebacterium sanguinis]MCT1555762.1 NAD(P)/FAD-dependent oxidoreductase [Corynebacterium sanguinis]MCT1664281.1 NAD(P)/FAD-dependent oxidoreductase [Corynebacterium sanguinis]MDN8576136.1 NAD(P)/FAD-dependent oxidoreductase [Corynebacterium sanguinis]
MTETPLRPAGNRHHVVIIGAGFGGIFAACDLADADVDVTIINRTNHHLFAPLLYQVATGLLSTGEIATSVRQALSGQDNVDVVRGDVTDIDVDAQTVTAYEGEFSRTYAYDSLIVAAGAGQSYFGNDHFAEFAPGLKTLDNALEIRARIITAFERAEVAETAEERERLLTFVIVGAGPTGVELAGQIAEMAHRSFAHGYSNFVPSQAKIVLIDGLPQVLPPFGKRLGKRAQRELEKKGVTVVLNSMVVNVDEDSVTYKDTKTEEETTIPTTTKIWSAGVQASPLGKLIADQVGVEAERNGKVPVNADLTVGDKSNVFIIGDMMSRDRLPGVAQVAIQTGEYVAKIIKEQVEHDVAPEARDDFEYFDKGSMAIVSRFNAVVKIGKVEVTGFTGWLLWLAVHVSFLVGVRNQFVTMLSWFANALSPKRYNLATTLSQMHGRTALLKLRDLATDEDALPELRDTNGEN